VSDASQETHPLHPHHPRNYAVAIQRVTNSLAPLKLWRGGHDHVAEPFPRNLALLSVLYIGEWPEMSPHTWEAKEGQNKKNQIK
jgi:hypothetical protein